LCKNIVHFNAERNQVIDGENVKVFPTMKGHSLRQPETRAALSMRGDLCLYRGGRVEGQKSCDKTGEEKIPIL